MNTNALLPLPVHGSMVSATTPISPGSDAAGTAREFESLFVSMMLKSMRQSMSKDMFAGDSSDTFGGLFDSFMGQHIAEHGGIGLARMLDSADLELATRKPSELSDTLGAKAQREVYQNAAATAE